MSNQSSTTTTKTTSGLSFSSLTGSNQPWSVPTAAGTDDTSSASVSLSTTAKSNELHGDFTSLAYTNTSDKLYPNQGLPPTALIDGIKVTVDRFAASAASISDYTVYLTKNVGGAAVNVGNNKATATAWPTTGGVANRATYGGPTDLWGTNWSYADVVDNKFGISIAAQNITNTAVLASVQFVQITVYWHVGKQAGVYKRYLMKVYSRAGVYLGKLPETSSVFSMGQDINTAGGNITITVPLSIDTAALQSAGSIQDETAVDLQDEAGNSLLTEGSTPVVSVGTGSGLIRNGNRIIVYETSYWYVNGRVLFRGVIENWAAEIGDSDEISIIAYSDASDLDWYPLTDGSGNTTVTYSSQDPSTGMLATFMTQYHAAGGLVTYNTASVDATGLSLTYKMKSNTVLEGIKAMLDLAPSGFYWYVDTADNTLYFKNASTTADVYLIKGRHLNSISITASIENVVNKLLFTGGDVSAGVSLFKQYSDSGSIALYGQRLDRKTDSRVTVTATADAIGNSTVAELKDEKFQTVVKLSDSTIDTAGLHVGLIIGFRGFGTFVDSLLMQVVSYQYTPEETTLTLGILPKRTSLHTEQMLRELVALQSLDNPVAPS